MDEDTIRLIARGLVLATAIPAVLSVIVHSFTPWRKTPLGVHLMAYMAALAAVISLTIVGWFIRGSIGFLTFYVTVFVALPIVTWWRLIIQWRAHREGRKVNGQSD